MGKCPRSCLHRLHRLHRRLHRLHRHLHRR
jgi:hypothetical protein